MNIAVVLGSHRNNGTSVDIEKLCEELPNSQITHLNISECNIGAEGLKLLCDILS